MGDMSLRILLATVVSYLLGSLPTGYLVTRWTRGVDIREVGERYSGAKNVFRVAGPIAGVLTAAVDIAKGALAIVQARRLQVPEPALLPVALAAISGHIWPVFLQFRGGAGFATALGIVMAALPREAMALFLPYVAAAATVGRRLGFGLTGAFFLFPMMLLSRRLGESRWLTGLPLAIGVFVAVRVYGYGLAQSARNRSARR